MGLFEIDLFSAVISLAVGFYLRTPLFIFFFQRFQAHPQLEELDLHQIDEGTAEFLMHQTNSLVRVGFGEPTLIRLPSPVSNVNANLIMLVNRATGDRAMVTTIFGNPTSLKTFYLEFSTRFDSGEVFDTLNSSQLSSFPPGPTTVRTQVPTLTDPAELYRLHTYVMSQHARGRTIVYERGQAFEYLTRKVLIESYDDQVERGLLHYDAKSATYRPTLRGTYWMTWGLMQPLKLIRTLRMQSDARRILAEFNGVTNSQPRVRQDSNEGL